ncbi:MAG: DUF402 domain-containing protein, partial [Oscillospiraceae bacterium]|nr:DUF402 domain-containing protein [Oscillospiraceae bacterium]
MSFGDVGLIRYSGVTEPVIKNSVPIIADGVEWLQLAPRGENWFMTAMFDRGELTQYYFDIADELFFGDEASFTDLYLDVLFIPGRKPVLLDLDELSAATEAGEITPSQAEKALAAARRLIARLETHASQLRSFCEEY